MATNAPDRDAAERRLLQTHTDRLDQATLKARELLDRWRRPSRELSAKD
jgi:hypothetical protein